MQCGIRGTMCYSPSRRQAIFWTNAGILLIGPLGTNLSEILIEFYTFSFKKMRLKLSSAKRRPFCLGFNVLIDVSGELVFFWKTFLGAGKGWCQVKCQAINRVNDVNHLMTPYGTTRPQWVNEENKINATMHNIIYIIVKFELIFKIICIYN